MMVWVGAIWVAATLIVPWIPRMLTETVMEVETPLGERGVR